MPTPPGGPSRASARPRPWGRGAGAREEEISATSAAAALERAQIAQCMRLRPEALTPSGQTSFRGYHLVSTSIPWTVCVPVGSSSSTTTRGSVPGLPPAPEAEAGGTSGVCAHSGGREPRTSPVARLWGSAEGSAGAVGVAGAGRATRMPASFSYTCGAPQEGQGRGGKGRGGGANRGYAQQGRGTGLTIYLGSKGARAWWRHSPLPELQNEELKNSAGSRSVVRERNQWTATVWRAGILL